MLISSAEHKHYDKHVKYPKSHPWGDWLYLKCSDPESPFRGGTSNNFIKIYARGFADKYRKKMLAGGFLLVE